MCLNSRYDAEDLEKLLRRVEGADREVLHLSEEVDRLRDVDRRHQECAQTQQRLQDRVDELEQSDRANADAVQKEKMGYETKLRKLERELQVRKIRPDFSLKIIMINPIQSQREADEEREAEEHRRRNVLRIEVEGAAARKLADAKREAADRAAEFAREEEAYKSEVSIPAGSTVAENEGDRTADVEYAAVDEDDDDAEAEERERRQRRQARLQSSSASASSSSSSSGNNSFCLARYRSVRDHNGRYFLVVKVR